MKHRPSTNIYKPSRQKSNSISQETLISQRQQISQKERPKAATVDLTLTIYARRRRRRASPVVGRGTPDLLPWNDNRRLPTTKKILNDEIKSDEKSLAAVLEELKTGNKILNSLIPVIRDTYKGIEAARLQDSVVFHRSKHNTSNVIHRKKINEWDSDDIYDWALGIRSVRKDPTHKDRKLLDDSKFLVEAMAVIMQGIKQATGGMPRHVHVIAVLVWFLRPEETGRILQVASSVERLTICTMLATILVLKGHKVDILYSSKGRATYEREDKYDYFAMFDIGVSVTEDSYEEDIDLTRGKRRKGDKLKIKEQEYKTSLEQQSRLKQEQPDADRKIAKSCYNADVVYGNVHNFKQDLLKEFYETYGYVTPTRGSRQFDSVVIDSFDSVTIDAMKTPSIVSLSLKGMEYTEYFQIAGWLELERYKQAKVAEDETKNAGKKSEVEDDESQTKNEMELEKHMEEYFRKLAIDETFSSDKDEILPMPIPASLRDLVKIQIPNWARMIVRADAIVEGKDYIVQTDKMGRKTIVPLSYATAGEMVALDQNEMWINGLQQFLQVKHRLRMTPEAIETA
ncbi:secA DEAD-like domain-containing protein [Ditylenchus destructor]|uniref:SecA DEAD-like domain-containing protein n=1 Tax=Ditylenchus destructor TaxID=166010 RepID=A0AAD4MLT9_9BILA|nr:secA DEAD-like domain-containing protein [Ditylenchus destructor]